MPPIELWEQERWELKAAPSFIVDEEDAMEDSCDEREARGIYVRE